MISSSSWTGWLCVMVAGLGIALAAASPIASRSPKDVPLPQRATEPPSSDGLGQSGDCPRGTRPGEILWTFDARVSLDPINGETLTPAVGDDRTVYFTSRDGILRAVDCHGAERWRFNVGDHMPGNLTRWTVAASPMVDGNGTIYLVAHHFTEPGGFSLDSILFALRPDGSLAWLHDRDDPVHRFIPPPVIDAMGRIFVGGAGDAETGPRGSIGVLDGEGHQLPGFPVPSQATFAGPVGLADGRVVFFGDAGFVIEPTAPPLPSPEATATPRPWGLRPVYLPMAATDRLAVPAAGADRADRLDRPEQIETLAEIRVVTDAHAPVSTFNLGLVMFSATTAAAGDVVFFKSEGSVTTDGGLRMLEGWSLKSDPPRQVLQYFLLGSGVASSVLLGGRDPTGRTVELLLLDTQGRMLSMNVPINPDAPAASTFNWASEVGNRAQVAPVLGDAGFVYAVVDGNRILAIDRADGSDGWSVTLEEESVVTNLTLSPDGVLYLGTESGKLLAIATESRGLDTDAAWPAVRHDSRNTGRAGW